MQEKKDTYYRFIQIFSILQRKYSLLQHKTSTFIPKFC